MKQCAICNQPRSRMRLQNPGKDNERYVCQSCLPASERSGSKSEGEPCDYHGTPHLHGYFMTPGYPPIPAVGVPMGEMMTSNPSGKKEYLN